MECSNGNLYTFLVWKNATLVSLTGIEHATVRLSWLIARCTGIAGAKNVYKFSFEYSDPSQKNLLLYGKCQFHCSYSENAICGVPSGEKHQIPCKNPQFKFYP